MASLFQAPAETGPYKIKFRIGGRQFKYSLKHSDAIRANETLAKVERILCEIGEGRVVIPDGADVVEFVKTDGGRSQKLEPQKKQLTLKDLFTTYEEKLTPGSKMARTRVLHRIHGRHLVRVIGNKPLVTLTKPGVLQEYVDTRVRSKYRGQPIKPQTISKEVKTLGAVWRWATENGHTNVTCPPNLMGTLTFPKVAQRQRFQTWSEIERHIARGKSTAAEQKAMWECLFLDTKQVEQALNFFEQMASPWLYRAVLFVAHTGARRSEMIRAEVVDFDFEHGIVKIRERKHAGGDLTFRQVPMSKRIRRDFEASFGQSGDRFAVSVDQVRAAEFLKDAENGPAAIEEYVTFASTKATRDFRSMIDKTNWTVLHGFHVFRHSFISNMARVGIDQRVIDDMVGHETEEMKLRYRHLFPEVRQSAISQLFDG
jgi:integrase